jgi:hypothetical protein
MGGLLEGVTLTDWDGELEKQRLENLINTARIDRISTDWTRRALQTGSETAFTVKDSGERHRFDSGMVRDTTTGKVNFWRVFIGPMLERWAAHVSKAAVKYPDVTPGVPNWTLAEGEEELQRFIDSAARHFYQWIRGDRDEDHAAAVMFNINGAEYVRQRMTDANQQRSTD